MNQASARKHPVAQIYNVYLWLQERERSVGPNLLHQMHR